MCNTERAVISATNVSCNYRIKNEYINDLIKVDKYKGGMPLHAEKKIINVAKQILNKSNIRILNLFSGRSEYGFKIDINPDVEPDMIADIHKLSDVFDTKNKFDVIFADPPYSNEESKEMYNTPKLNYKKWSKEADKFLVIGGLFIVYHKYLMPNPNPQKYIVIARIFIGTRIWHLARIVTIFLKKTQKEIFND